jgi:hypothetical protein
LYSQKSKFYFFRGLVSKIKFFKVMENFEEKDEKLLKFKANFASRIEQ